MLIRQARRRQADSAPHHALFGVFVRLMRQICNEISIYEVNQF
jgi:hypothetical protein